MNAPDDFLPCLLADHLTRYPKMEARDVYKLLFQAVLGAEHAVRDEAAARDWLYREQREMGGGPSEPVLDPLSPDGRLVRVHLRPYLAAGGDPEALLRAFVRTANEWRGAPETLRTYGRAAARMLDSDPALSGIFTAKARRPRGSPKVFLRALRVFAVRSPGSAGPLTGEAIRSFFATMESQDFPAAHHSRTYWAAYRPAYRVVAREFLEGA